MLVGIAIEIPFAIGEAVLGVEAYLIRYHHPPFSFKYVSLKYLIRHSLLLSNICISQMSIPHCAILFRDWRTLQMVAYLPLLALIGLW